MSWALPSTSTEIASRQLAVGAVVVAGALYLIHHSRGDTESPQEEGRDLIYYLATPREREEVSSLRSREEVDWYLAKFYERKAVAAGVPADRFREAHEQRWVYANAQFGEAGPGWRSDRGRVYILHGPPYEVRGYDQEVRVGSGSTWKGLLFWEYRAPAGTNQVPRLFRSFLPGITGKTFVFARTSEAGAYRQVYSTEAGETVDPIVYQAEP